MNLYNLAMAALFVFILIVFLLVLGLLLLWRFALRKPKSDLPGCGKCGYAVRGAPSLACPECGADLREVGISKPRRGGGLHPLVFLLGWTVLYGAVAFMLTGVAIALGPMVQTGDANQSIRPQSPQALYTIDVDWRWRMPGNNHPGSSVSTGTLTPNGPRVSTFSYGEMQPATEISDVRLMVFTHLVPATESSLEFEPDGSGYRYVNATGKTVQATGPLDAAGVKQWFADAGIQTDPATLDAESADIATFANGVINKQPRIVLNEMRTGSSGSGSSTSPADWWLILVLSIHIAIWLAGILIFWRLRRQKTVTG